MWEAGGAAGPSPSPEPRLGPQGGTASLERPPGSYKFLYSSLVLIKGFPSGSDGTESACDAEDLGLIPELGRSPGEGKGYPLQYSGLENPMDYTGRNINNLRYADDTTLIAEIEEELNSLLMKVKGE